jgi:hypothetical protein
VAMLIAMVAGGNLAWCCCAEEEEFKPICEE